MVFSLYISLAFSFSCIDRQLSFFILSLLLSTQVTATVASRLTKGLQLVSTELKMFSLRKATILVSDRTLATLPRFGSASKTQTTTSASSTLGREISGQMVGGRHEVGGRHAVFLSGQASQALHRPGRAALSGGF